MSYDVFFQGFIAGESSERGGAQMAEILRPHVTKAEGSFRQVRYGDGGADVYLNDADADAGMMANHIEGRDVWELLVRGAQAANWVILPLDRPVCLTASGQLEELPEGLEQDTRWIATGAELRELIETP